MLNLHIFCILFGGRMKKILIVLLTLTLILTGCQKELTPDEVFNLYGDIIESNLDKIDQDTLTEYAKDNLSLVDVVVEETPPPVIEAKAEDIKNILDMISKGNITASREFIDENALTETISKEQKEEIIKALKLRLEGSVDNYYTDFTIANNEIFRGVDVFKNNYEGFIGAEYFKNILDDINLKYDERVENKRIYLTEDYFPNTLFKKYCSGIKDNNIRLMKDLHDCNEGFMSGLTKDDTEVGEIFANLMKPYIDFVDYVDNNDLSEVIKNKDSLSETYPNIDNDFISIVLEIKLKSDCYELIQNTEIKSAISIIDQYVKAYEISEDNNIFELRKICADYKSAMSKIKVVKDDFEGTTNTYYKGVEKISKSINVVPFIENDKYFSFLVGFHQSDWIFFDTIKVKLSDDDMITQYFDYNDVMRDVKRGIYEIAETSFSDSALNRMMKAEKLTIRFIGKDDKYRDHTFTKDEKNAITALYSHKNFGQLVADYYK